MATTKLTHCIRVYLPFDCDVTSSRVVWWLLLLLLSCCSHGGCVVVVTATVVVTSGKVENTFLTFLTCHKLKKYVFGYLIQERCATYTILFLLV